MKRIIRNFLFLSLLLVWSCSPDTHYEMPVSLQTLQEGDLLFVAKGKDNAITDVTKGVDGLKIDHVAIFHHTDSVDYALEAFTKGVVLTPLKDFIFRTNAKEEKPKIVVGRVIVDFDVEQSVHNALQHLGKKYDRFYMPDDKEIYCSELVQKSYVNHQGELIFSPIPMSFRDENGNIPDVWKQIYAYYKLEIPEGKPGSNPGDLSRRKELKIGYDF